MSVSSWQLLGRVAPADLVPARLQLHYAAQLAAGVGATFLDARPDDSHPNLGWNDSLRSLVGHEVAGPPAFHAGLRPAEVQLLLLDGEEKVVGQLGLAGRNMVQAARWLGEEIGRLGIEVPPRGVERPAYELPDHPLAHGSTFTPRPIDAFEELAVWFGNASGVLGSLTASTEGASELRCWPHHFDLATLITLASAPDGSATHTVGVGLSPGDDHYPEPYWYVSPWPYPDGDVLVPLDDGHWHTEGFTAAILTGTELVSSRDPAEQAERTRAFIDAAVGACRGALAT